MVVLVLLDPLQTAMVGVADWECFRSLEYLEQGLEQTRIQVEAVSQVEEKGRFEGAMLERPETSLLVGGPS